MNKVFEKSLSYSKIFKKYLYFSIVKFLLPSNYINTARYNNIFSNLEHLYT